MIIRVLLVFAAAGAGLSADQVDRGERHTVTVCLEGAGSFTLNRASSLVSKMTPPSASRSIGGGPATALLAGFVSQCKASAFQLKSPMP
jgi:hypothetical protein